MRHVIKHTGTARLAVLNCCLEFQHSTSKAVQTTKLSLLCRVSGGGEQRQGEQSLVAGAGGGGALAAVPAFTIGSGWELESKPLILLPPTLFCT